MRHFENKVAVVTGAASGIGLALARRFSRAGMRLVLADIDPNPLAAVAAELNALAVPTDVSQAAEVVRLAEQTLAAHGAVHLLCNNAGVGGSPAPIWETSLPEAEWILGVNLWGVIHGLRAFVPILLRQNVEAHIVNTASVAGLLSPPNLSLYNASKHAVVTLSETLAADLAALAAPIGVSVLCPAFVNTRIMDTAHRPSHLPPPPALSPIAQSWSDRFHRRVAAGVAPDQIAEQVFAAIEANRLHILTHPDFRDEIAARTANILAP
jgi:NAD(P)-dependent dehydrogenase (short-subunit alcohol dehydrogenase family)